MLAIDPIAFRLFNLEIRWYGILIALALVAGIVISYFIAKYREQKPEEVINFAPFAVIAGIIGARLLHVVVNWSVYSSNPVSIFFFRQGGLAIQGVMLGGVIALLIFCKVRKLDFWLWADIIAPALIFGQAVGRWGNYFNQEAFGLPTSVPWAIYIDPMNRPAAYSNAEFFHPTFFYESMANLLLFIFLLVLHRLYKRRKDIFPSGLIFSVYLGLYAVYRTFIEYYRVDSSYWGPIKVVYVLDILAVLAAILIVYYRVKWLREKKQMDKLKDE